MPRPVIAPARSCENEDRERAWKQTLALDILHEARDPRRTIVERYLNEERGLALPDEIAGAVIRFHARCPWTDESGGLIRVPAMVAAMRCIHTDKLVAIHRTRLTPDGKKVSRLTLGPVSGAAIKLDADENVTLGLVLAEGLETALSARQFGYAPVWAAGSAGAISKFPVLNGVEGLTLAAEDDSGGANARAIGHCGRQWRAAGREVIVLASGIGGDLNNALTGKRP
jgi:hypothetical protein